MAVLSRFIAKQRYQKVAPYIQGDVLDLGCQKAQILEEFGSSINSYCGVELLEETVVEAKKKHQDASFYQRDLDQDELNLPDKFDCILMVALIEHLFNQKFVMDSVAQCLKPGGVVVLTTPTPFGNDVVHRAGASLGLFSKVAVDDHIVIYNRLRFKILANEVGLELRHHEYFQLGCNQLAILSKPAVSTT